MSKKVRDLRLQLEALANGHPSSKDGVLTSFLLNLVDLDDMDIEEFFARLLGKSKQATGASKTAVDSKALANRLRSSLANDDLFHLELQKLETQKSITKPILAKIYYDLFNRTRGVPSKATRTDLFRLIGDERNKVVRDEKMQEMLTRRIVPAE